MVAGNGANLSGHASAQVDIVLCGLRPFTGFLRFSLHAALSRYHLKHNCACELVMRMSTAFRCFKDVDRVP